jgi:hypothetical protein
MPRRLSTTAQAIVIDPPSLPYAAWPPKDKFGEMNVSRGGWDWGSAAVSHGIFDPLDLIHFNFGTTAFGEVNWYLWQYVGCVNSDDGKNFKFDGADPGIIYIPQFGYTRKTPGVTAVEQNALKVLRTKILPRYPDFWHKGVHFKPKDLEILIHKIERNKVDIIWDTSNSKEEGGHWSFKDSTIYLSWTGRELDSQTLVHEATHVLVDILTASYAGVKRYKNIDDEFACFFAEAYWFMQYYGPDAVELEIYFAHEPNIFASALYLAYIARMAGDWPLVPQLLDKPHENTIEKSSASYVESIPRKKPIFPDPFNPYDTLMKAIERDPLYRDTAMHKRGWVRRPVGKGHWRS